MTRYLVLPRFEHGYEPAREAFASTPEEAVLDVFESSPNFDSALVLEVQPIPNDGRSAWFCFTVNDDGLSVVWAPADCVARS